MSESGNPYTEEERLLVESCLKGDRKAQKRLYDTYARKMMPICLRYTGDRQAAEDLLHDAFVKVYVHLPDFKGEGSFDGWMRRIFVNTALEQVRREAVLPATVDASEAWDLASDDYTAFDRLSEQDIMECIRKLPALLRTVFNMYAVEGYSHKEIADALGITESSSRVYLLRARQQLQEMLSNHNRHEGR